LDDTKAIILKAITKASALLLFRSENYANFIYLFFKIGTEVNVFAHLGKVLFTQMKEQARLLTSLHQQNSSLSYTGENFAKNNFAFLALFIQNFLLYI